jgi:plastocyanin
VDLTQAATRVVRFPNGNDTYSPKCARVKFGQSVTFSGDFGFHPLTQACGPVSGVLSGTGSSTTITFDRGVGLYGFYCANHGFPSGAGMSGAIEVVR